MSKTHIIQLKSNNSGNQNSSFLPCQMDVSLAEPILLENGDVMQLRAAFLDFRQQGTNSIVITSDLNFTFQFYYYVVPNNTNGFDVYDHDNTIENPNYQTLMLAANPSYLGTPYILMIHKQLYEDNFIF